jgi:hypothetical protein
MLDAAMLESFVDVSAGNRSRLADCGSLTDDDLDEPADIA